MSDMLEKQCSHISGRNPKGWSYNRFHCGKNHLSEKDHPATKYHFGLTQDCILHVFEHVEPVRKDHLSYKTTWFWQKGWSYNTGFTVFYLSC